MPPALWMHGRAATWLVQFLEFGYFAFYPLYPVVGGIFWGWRERPPFANAFRRLTDALSVGYVICYATFLLFPVRSPANSVGVQQFSGAPSGPVPQPGWTDPKPRRRAWECVSQCTHHAGIRRPGVCLPFLAAPRPLALISDSADVRGRGVRRIPLFQRRDRWRAARDRGWAGIRAWHTYVISAGGIIENHHHGGHGVLFSIELFCDPVISLFSNTCGTQITSD